MKIVWPRSPTVSSSCRWPIKRVKQYREGYPALIESHNKEAVTALREIAQGKVLPGESIPEAGIHIDG